MELNSKKLESTSRIIYYSISFILCLFLILLSNRIIDDLDRTTRMPEIESFENKVVLKNLERNAVKLNTALEKLVTRRSTVEKTISTARDNYRNEKQSFENWLETRKTLGSPDKDREVLARARNLDQFYKVEQDWRAELNMIQAQVEAIEKQKAGIQKSTDNERLEAEKKYNREFKRYELRVFLIRLLFVAPILALGVSFFIRYRRHKFWPIYFGFTLFSLYAFFFGLVPYLPSYGGYVRYSVGIVLSAGLGYYAIKTIRHYIEHKKAELKISTEERAKRVPGETAEKALQGHFCPSCGKDFLIKKWEFPLTKITESDAYKLVTDFCRHCGLELFKNCGNCDHKNFAHIPFCASCGTHLADKN